MNKATQSTDQEPITSTLLADEPELFELVAKFVSGLPEQCTNLKQALNNQDWVDLKQQIHDLKGLGGNFGFPVLSTLASQIEQEIASQEYANIPALLLELDAVCQRIQPGKNVQ